MPLKIKPEDMAILRERINAIAEARPGAKETYLRAGYSHMRYRWDMLYATRLKIGCATAPGDLNLYDYMDDTHIDSALREILGSRY